MVKDGGYERRRSIMPTTSTKNIKLDLILYIQLEVSSRFILTGSGEKNQIGVCTYWFYIMLYYVQFDVVVRRFLPNSIYNEHNKKYIKLEIILYYVQFEVSMPLHPNG